MQHWKDIVQKAGTLHASIAEKLEGTRLECVVCPHTYSPSTSELANYVANGWPKHCGQTMSLISKKEV